MSDIIPHPDLLWVEYRELNDGRWVPFSVCTVDGLHSVEWCREHETLYAHWSGSGGDGFHVSAFCAAPKRCAKLWRRADVKLVHSVKVGEKWTTAPCSDEEAVAKGYELIGAPLVADPLAECEQSETQYCSVCDDHLPSEEGNPCRHLAWMSWGEWGGCGGEVRDETVREHLRLVCATLTEAELVALRDGLLGRHYHSRVDGWMFGPDWLTFRVGGRWSDAQGGGECRNKSAPPDVDDPVGGKILVPFPTPGGPAPTTLMDIGPKLTRLAEERRDDGDWESDWMNGVSWLRSLDAAADCREAEAFAGECITEWLAELAGFTVSGAKS